LVKEVVDVILVRLYGGFWQGDSEAGVHLDAGMARLADGLALGGTQEGGVCAQHDMQLADHGDVPPAIHAAVVH